jgi:hypothetical protein
MRWPWEPGTGPELRLLDRARQRNGVHALALRRQLAWAKEFALAGDLMSALDALGDAGALAQELRATNGHGPPGHAAGYV